eukprot:4071705-Lingulodinium_polyedra.AAC.1
MLVGVTEPSGVGATGHDAQVVARHCRWPRLDANAAHCFKRHPRRPALGDAWRGALRHHPRRRGAPHPSHCN